MKTFLISLALGFGALVSDSAQTVYQFNMQTIDGKEKSLAEYKGKVLLIVNTASKCGYTPQYEGLEELYQTYKDQGLVVLGFPANNFGGQEPGSDAQIKQFCSSNYGVTFPMFSKISVKGNDMHPLYQFLADENKNGAVDGAPRWNFHKYLVNKEGEVVASYPSGTTPMSKKLTTKVEELIK